MTDYRGGIDLQDGLILHPDLKGAPTIETMAVNTDFHSWKQPAHG